MASSGDTVALTKGLLGLGFWVQGFRVLPRMSLRLFLKDSLGVSPATLQLVFSTANIPMVAKPIYGILSDAVYICGAHRLPYITIGVTLQVISWTLMAILLSTSYMTATTLFILLFLTVLGAAVVEVANDAIVAEAGRGIQPTGHLQTYVWTFDSSGSIIGYLLSAFAVNHLSFRTTFWLFVAFLIIQLFITISIPEEALGLTRSLSISSSSPRPLLIPRLTHRPQFISSDKLIHRMSVSLYKKRATSCFEGIVMQFQLLTSALQRREIFYSICWYFVSDAIIPSLVGNMLYYQTKILDIDSSLYGISKIVKQGWVLLCGAVYNSWFRSVSTRRVLATLQCAIVFIQLSDAFFVQGFYRGIGVADPVYVVLFSGILEALIAFKGLPFTLLMARLCPPGCEASVMALVMSTSALSGICSAYSGILVTSVIGVSGNEQSRLVYAILMQGIFTTVPLYWCSWISG